LFIDLGGELVGLLFQYRRHGVVLGAVVRSVLFADPGAIFSHLL
jgi:hypothetical protein